MKLSPSVWAVTGIKRESFDRSEKKKLLPDEITGCFTGTGQTIMKGENWVDDVESVGYAYLSVSMQKMEEFENKPLAERGLGAVSGGFISSSNFTCSEPFKTEQEWGVIDTSKAIYVCGFFSADSTGMRYNHVMVCFDTFNAAPVSGFWRNEVVMVGPNIQCDKMDWGRNHETGSYAVALEKVTSTVVLKVEFPKVSADGDGATKTIEPEMMFSQTFTNGSSATAKDSFNLKTKLLDTHTFAFEEGWGVDWSAEWKAEVPLLSGSTTKVEVEVPFAAHQPCATSKTQTIDRTAEINLAPMTGVKATARCSKRVITVDAVLTVQKTYTNGAVETRKVSTKYTSVSRDNVEIRLENVPVVPTSIQ